MTGLRGVSVARLLVVTLAASTGAVTGCGGTRYGDEHVTTAGDVIAAKESSLVPQPKQVRWRSGSFAPDHASVQIVLLTNHTPVERTAAEAVQAKLLQTHDVRAPINAARRPGGPYQIAFRKPTAAERASTPALSNREGYLLKVYSNRVLLIASKPRGRYLAAQTLRQLIARGRDLRCVRIADYPTLPFRALHFYMNRYTYPEACFYEGLIDAAARLKYNAVVMMFYGTLQLSTHPEWVNESAYSKAEIAPLVAQGRREGLAMIPEMKAWGHANGTFNRRRNVIVEYDPALSRLFVPVSRPGYMPRTFSTRRPYVRRILADTCKEMSALFGRPKYFHLGCDEAIGATNAPEELPYPSRQLTAEHLTRVAGLARKRGSRPIIWGDMLLERAAWQHVKHGHSVPPRYTHTAIDDLPKDIIIADWHYYPLPIPPYTQDRYDSLQYFRSHGFDVVGSCWGYFGLENITQMARDVVDCGGLGLMQTTWRRLKSAPQCVVIGADAAWNGGDVDVNSLPYPPLIVIKRMMKEHCGADWRNRLTELRYPGDDPSVAADYEDVRY